MRDIKERSFRLRVELHLILSRTAVGAMIGKRSVPRTLASLLEKRPRRQLPGEPAIHGRDIGRCELRQRLSTHGARRTVNANDLDRSVTIQTWRLRGGNICLVRD